MFFTVFQSTIWNSHRIQAKLVRSEAKLWESVCTHCEQEHTLSLTCWGHHRNHFLLDARISLYLMVLASPSYSHKPLPAGVAGLRSGPWDLLQSYSSPLCFQRQKVKMLISQGPCGQWEFAKKFWWTKVKACWGNLEMLDPCTSLSHLASYDPRNKSHPIKKSTSEQTKCHITLDDVAQGSQPLVPVGTAAFWRCPCYNNWTLPTWLLGMQTSLTAQWSSSQQSIVST